MKRFILFALLGLFVLNTFAVQPVVTKKFHKELSRYFESENIVTKELSELANKNDLFFKVSDSDKEIGLVVLTSAMGRYDRFDYMIIYNTMHEIQMIKVLVYRSDYGSEITAKRWLSQFYSRKDDTLKYGSDIQAISGATFSAMSLTKNVNRINNLLKEYFKGK